MSVFGWPQYLAEPQNAEGSFGRRWIIQAGIFTYAFNYSPCQVQAHVEVPLYIPA